MSTQPLRTSVSPTYTELAILRDKLRTSKIRERRLAAKELLDKLSDTSTHRKLEWEAQCGFVNAKLRNSNNVGDASFPRERVSILFRNLLDAAILSSNMTIAGTDSSSSSRSSTKRIRANQTGFIKKSCKFTAEDILFPFKVFLRLDGPGLECLDGGYGSPVASWEEDWKTKPRYGFHLAPLSSGRNGSFSAMHYMSHSFTDDDRGTRLSSKEILSCVNYCISCLNDDDCCEQAETELLNWLAHICCRPDYVASLPLYFEVSHILHEISTRLSRGFGCEGNMFESPFVAFDATITWKRKNTPINSENLFAASKCLSGLVYNCTTRLGIGMQLYLRPIVELIAWWAQHAWDIQSGGRTSDNMICSGNSQSSNQILNLRTESDIISLLPYLYSSVTHIFAAYPEQSIPVLSEWGHALLRLARKNFLKSPNYPQIRDALTEYIGSHLLVAETSGKLHGLPAGDLGPLVDPDDSREKHIDDHRARLGATFDRKSIDGLLDMIRNEKIWESLFPSSGGDQETSMNLKSVRRKSPSRRKMINIEGGGTWSPLNRKQRRYLELVIRLLRLSQRLHLAEAESRGDGSSDALESLVEDAVTRMQRQDIEHGVLSLSSGHFDDADSKHAATNEELAISPWVQIISRCLYELNPRLTKPDAPLNESSPTQVTHNTGDAINRDINCDHTPLEQCLLESCPLLRALVTRKEDSVKADSTTSSRLTVTASLQLICASAESYPRGECWSSSTRRYWSTTLDESYYPEGGSARIYERNGSSPDDAAAVVYLLGITLESCGGSGGDESVQVWTLMALLKMAESSAVIRCREGLHPQSLNALSSAWQNVWQTLFRYDLRFSSYTAVAHANNAGELVLQLMTQIIRYQCTDRSLAPCSSFIQGQSNNIWNLPVFENTSAILSGTCFELVSSVIRVTNLSDMAERGTSTVPYSTANTQTTKDRKWFISFCLRFVESALLEDNTQSGIQRSFLPFVSMCLASLITDGDITFETSTFELDNLTLFSTTEDTEPVCHTNRLGHFEPDYKSGILRPSHIINILWTKSMFPYIYPVSNGNCSGQRDLQGRGAILNRYLAALRERERISASLRLNTRFSSCFAHKRSFGDMATDRILTIFNEIIGPLSGGDEDEDSEEVSGATNGGTRHGDAPFISGCLLLVLAVILSSHHTLESVVEVITGIAEDTIFRALENISIAVKSLTLQPPDLLATLNHLDGFMRVITYLYAAGIGKALEFPILFRDQFEGIFVVCKMLLRNHRNSAFTAKLTAIESISSRHRRGPEYDSDEDNRFTTGEYPNQRPTQKSKFSDDDSDGFMDDEVGGKPSKKIRAPLKQRVPPPKRRRIENGTKSFTPKPELNFVTVDSRCAWALSALMISFQPSIECLETISGHLVWPDDYDNENGCEVMSKTIDPFGALVCASLFCQKSVVVRQQKLSLSQSNRNIKEFDDNQSAIALCIEVIHQARRSSSPSSKFFMCGLGILSDLVEVGDKSESRPHMTVTESKLIVDAIYPEGVHQGNDDYRFLRQLKKTFKCRSFYKADQLFMGTQIFANGQDNVHSVFDSTFSEHFIKSSCLDIDENIRSLACDALGVALSKFSDQQLIVSEMTRNILPPLKNEKKYSKWLNSLEDTKLPVELSQLEHVALSDARLSFEFHAIECIGVIAGSTTDDEVCRNMIWTLVEVSVCEPRLGLICSRASERAALMLGFKQVCDLFSDMEQFLLAKWIEARQILYQIPILIMSSFALQGACRFFPHKVLNILAFEEGRDDVFWSLVESRNEDDDGNDAAMKNRFVSTYIESVADILIPSFLLMGSDSAANVDEKVDATSYLSEFALIVTTSTNDESITRILRRHISDILAFVNVLQSDNENSSIQEVRANAYKYLTMRVSETHLHRDGTKQANLILRRILKLCANGLYVSGQKVHLLPKCFIEGMRNVTTNIVKTSHHGGFLGRVGSSVMELFILSIFWLSSSLSITQRQKMAPIHLLCDILQEQIREATITSPELSFCLDSLISTALDPKNHQTCFSLLTCLNETLRVLFHHSKDKMLVEETIGTIHKLSLALLQIHKKSFLYFYKICDAALSCNEFDKKRSHGLLLSNRHEENSWDDDSSSLYNCVSNEENVLKELIALKATMEEQTCSDIMIVAYDCLDAIVNSGNISLEDVLGAQDIVHQLDHNRRRVFLDANEKYDVDSLFIVLRLSSVSNRDFSHECRHFLHIMEQYPISDGLGFRSLSSQVLPDARSVDALARLLALQRLEKSMNVRSDSDSADNSIFPEVVYSLIRICQSADSEEAKIISSKCLGDMHSARNFEYPVLSRGCPAFTTDHHDSKPLEAIKMKAIELICRFLISPCADVSLIASKTVKALLTLSDVQDCWRSLDNKSKGVLKPLISDTDSSSQRECITLSKSHIQDLKLRSGASQDGSSWCWNDDLWTCCADDIDDAIGESWIKNVVCSIIYCCLNNESNPDCRFFRICQGLCAKESEFAALLFPGIIFYLLDTDSSVQSDRKRHSVRDLVLLKTAIGFETSEMNNLVSHCFARILGTISSSPYAVSVVLDTLDMLHAITKKRFCSSSDHVRNAANNARRSTSKTKKNPRKSSCETGEYDDTANSTTWRGIPYGVVLRLDGLVIAKASLRMKRFYSALFYCEMAMTNYSRVGNFFESSDIRSISHDSIISDISGFGIEQEIDGRSVLEITLAAKDICVRCLIELQQTDELQGLLGLASALSLEQNMSNLKSIHEDHCDQTLPALVGLDLELQESGVAGGNDALKDVVAGVTSCLENLGLEHVKRHYLLGVSASNGLNFHEKWFEDALRKACEWDTTLLTLPDGGNTSLLPLLDTRFTSTSSVGFATFKRPRSFYEAIYHATQNFARDDISAGYCSITEARKTVIHEIGLLKESESKLNSMTTQLAKLNLLGSFDLAGKAMGREVPVIDVLKRLGVADETGVHELKSLLLGSDIPSLDIREQTNVIDVKLFRLIETHFSVKEILLKLLLKRNQQDRHMICQSTASHVYKSCQVYRELGRPDVAKIAISRLRSLLQVFEVSDVEGFSYKALPLFLRLEDAKVLSRRRDFSNAISHCKMIANHISNLPNPDDDCSSLLAESLLLGGLLMAHQNVDAVGLMESFFERAAALSHQAHQRVSSASNAAQASMAYFKLGDFSSTLHEQLDARVSSDTWKQRQNIACERDKEVASLQSEVDQLQKKQKRSKKQDDTIALEDAYYKLSALKKELEFELRELTHNQDGLQKYLSMAVGSFCNALSICPTSSSMDCSKCVFKLIGLWFKNYQKSDTQHVVNDLLKSRLCQIPSYHFVPLTYQIFSRIDENDSSFQTTLRSIVHKICLEHPYHGIVQLIALSNGKLIGSGVCGRNAKDYLSNIGDSKVEAAKCIISELQKTAPEYVVGLIDCYERLMGAYIDLAVMDTGNIPRKQAKGFTFSSFKLKLDVCLSGGRRGQRDHVLKHAPAIITNPPSIRPDADYGSGIEDPVGTERVLGFEASFELAPSGIHRPAIVVCLGSKGGKFKQLVKGADDMRQDAIMQQVFGTVNNLLNLGDQGDDLVRKSLGHTFLNNSTRRLKVITYGITPLSPTSGVLEWVEHTQSFGHFMQDGGKTVGAHSKYYPGEWSTLDCRELYANGFEQKKQEERRRDFDIICRNTSPVFRFFFMENFSSSMEAWHSARTAYTRSCAVNSIVGHVLGIGDRHTQNILVHTKTGEVVHIDFGFVFEQGKLQRTPETVPFRLTRNIIDGMGPCGTEGVFSKSAEATLSVLRKNSDTLLTILSAVVSDPLYRWSVNKVKTQGSSRGDRPGEWKTAVPEENGNEAAERALSKVNDKLQGYEDGTSGMHTVEGQVNFLINAARDPNNLCNLFSGWQSWI